MKFIVSRFNKYAFMLKQLVKRDFKSRYSRSNLGIVWSMLSPLAMTSIQALVFAYLLRFDLPHRIVYIVSGNIIFSYFSESTKRGLSSLSDNAPIFTKTNAPKYLFLLSRNAASFINFVIMLGILLIFAALDGLGLHWRYFMLLYPILCLAVFNIGMGLILSAAFIFFRDLQHLYDIVCQILMYLSAIFYTIDRVSESAQWVFYCNPLFVYIRYFRIIIIEGQIPGLWLHLLAAAYALVAIILGGIIYYRQNYKFIYYV